MKKTFSLILIMAVTFLVGIASLYAQPGKKAPAPQQTRQAGVVTGKVVETMDTSGYTYFLLTTGEEKTWFAVPQTKVTVGQTVSVNSGFPMFNYESKTLNRKFDKVIFSEGLVQKKGK